MERWPRRRGHQELKEDIDVVGLHENLVDTSGDSSQYMHDCSDEGRHVLITHVVHIRAEPRGNLVPRGALLGQGLVRALLLLLPLCQLCAHLAMLPVQHLQHVVGGGDLKLCTVPRMTWLSTASKDEWP